MNWDRKWLIDCNAGKMQLVLFDRSNNTGAVYVKNLGLFLRKNHLLKWWGCLFSFKFDWGSYTISVAISASNTIGALCLSLEVSLYLY